jgi:hypothetical protein
MKLVVGASFINDKNMEILVKKLSGLANKKLTF